MRRVLPALLVALPALAVLPGATTVEADPVVPAGFTDELVTDEVSRPTAVEPLPDNRVVVLEQHTGRVRLIDANTGALEPGFALELPVCTAREQGLLGFTEDPQFLANGRIYVYYTTPVDGVCRNRVSAFTMAGDTISPASEQLLVEMRVGADNHNGGDLEIGDDGWLYVSVGDGGTDPRGDSGSAGANDAAQDMSILHGKILRLDRWTGRAAAGNPFIDHPNGFDCGTTVDLPATSRVCREIYAYGLRNPFRFAFTPNGPALNPNGGTGSVFRINDVGQATQEEINDNVQGANYGWPFREGNCPQGLVPPCDPPPPELVDPIEAYTHATGGYITAGAFVPNGFWPEAFDDGYLFADAGAGTVWLLDGGGDVDYGDPFVEGAFGIADMAFVMEPAGWALYYTQPEIVTGVVRKVTFDAAPSAPSGPLTYERLATAQRPFDSRTGLAPAPLRAGKTRLIELGPVAAGAEAALVNITFASPTAGTFATVWEPRTTRPATSNVNALFGEVVANASIVPVDDDGRIMLYTRATTDVIVDVVGVFKAAPAAIEAGRFESSAVTRVIDSRQPSGPDNIYTRAPSGSGEVVNVPIADIPEVPDSGVDAVAFILSGISDPTPGAGWLVAYPGGATRPPSSNVNVNGLSDVRVNTAVVPLGADGSIDVYMENVGDVIVEVVGWFTDGSVSPSTDGRFRLVNPTREVDTRSNLGFGPLGDGEIETINPASVPDGSSGVVQNLTFAPAGGWGFVTAFGDPPAPLLSNLNATAPGQVRAALALTPLAASGAESFLGASPANRAEHQFLVDVFGYFE